MAISKRQDLPDTFVRLLAWVIDDTWRTLRTIAIVGFLLFLALLGITLGAFIAGAEGIRVSHPGFLSAGITGGVSGLTLITIIVRELLKKRKRRRASGKESSGTS